MKPFLKNLILAPLCLLAVAQGKGQSRSITYRWLNQPCAEMINCDEGCSACNLPEGDQVVLGTNAALIGVTACPHPFAVGDNALLLSGWPFLPDNEHRLVASVMSLVNVQIDSVVVVHRRMDDGPVRLRVSVKNLAGVGQVMREAPIPEQFDATAITDCGTAMMLEGMAYAGFQIELQAFNGEGGWYLDELRIVMSALEEDISTGVEAIAPQHRPSTFSSSIGLLGQHVAGVRTSGLQIRKGNTIIIP